MKSSVCCLFLPLLIITVFYFDSVLCSYSLFDDDAPYGIKEYSKLPRVEEKCEDDNETLRDFPGQADRVTSLQSVALPLGQNYCTVGHYSGYLKVDYFKMSEHYWFFRAQSAEWQTAPLVVWFGGWVSVLHSALTGISPIRMNPNGNLSLNPHSWNKRANLLFVESLTDVGYLSVWKYVVISNDSVAVKFALSVLEGFYEKFPQLSQNELYLAGEGHTSYLISITAKELVEAKFPHNFKGVLIGNEVFNLSETVNSHFQFVHKVKRDLYNHTFWNNLTSICCPPNVCQSDECTFRECQIVTNKELYESSTFPYSRTPLKTLTDCQKFYLNFYEKFYWNPQSRYPSSQLDLHNIHEKCVPSVRYPTCTRYIITNKINEWLNLLASVQIALHLDYHNLLQDFGNFITWFPLPIGLYDYYNGDYDATDLCSFKREYSTLHGHLMFLLRNNVRVLLFTGDGDGVSSPYNTKWLLDDLSLTPIKTLPSNWEFEDEKAGIRKSFCEGLTYYTVKGAGHSVAEDRPGPALKMVNEFLFGNNSDNPRNAACPEIAPNCTKHCSTNRSAAQGHDGFCVFWKAALFRYYIYESRYINYF